MKQQVSSGDGGLEGLPLQCQMQSEGFPPELSRASAALWLAVTDTAPAELLLPGQRAALGPGPQRGEVCREGWQRAERWGTAKGTRQEPLQGTAQKVISGYHTHVSDNYKLLLRGMLTMSQALSMYVSK